MQGFVDELLKVKPEAEVVSAYDAYTKRCVRDGTQFLMPEDWARQELEKLKPQPPAEVRDPSNDAAIMERFSSLMLDSGFRKRLTIMESARHYLKLGDLSDFRQRVGPSQRPRRLCEVCNEDLCPYSD